MIQLIHTRTAVSGRRRQRGFTLIEMIVATAILLILVGLAIPSVKFAVKREREHELRYDLWMMRDAIDRYKDAADRGAFQTKVGSDNWPPDLDKLVEVEDVAGKKLKFLRKINLPPVACGVITATEPMARSIWPPTASAVIGPPPLYGI